MVQLKNFGAVGIYVDPVQQISLQNLVVNNIGAAGSINFGLGAFVAGIFITGLSNPSFNNNINIDNVKVYNVSPQTANVAGFGLYIIQAQDVYINNSHFNQNISSLNTIGGINITACSRVRLSNVDASDNVGLIGAYGMIFQAIQGLRCVDCIASANSLSGTVPNSAVPYVASGFLLNGCIDYTFQNCVGNENRANVAGAGSTGPLQHASGFEVYASADGNFENCVAETNNGPAVTGGSAYGFHLGSDNTKVTNCFAVNNNGYDTAWGFAVEAFRNDIFPPQTFQRNVVIDKSVAEFNNVTSGTGTLAGGIKLQDVQNSVVSNSVASNNSNDGILLIETIDCNTINNLIKNNELVSNIVWGIQDATVGTDNVYIGNNAINNPGDGTFTNFNAGVRNAGGGVPGTANAFIVPWAVPGLPPAVTDIDRISNLDITSSCSVPLP